MRPANEPRTLRVDQILEPETPSRINIDPESILELAQSIARLGLLEPIGVKPSEAPDYFTLVYGHRRLLAVRHLGYYTIQAIILPADLPDSEARQAENSQRVQLTPVEEARELRRWHEGGESVPSLATRLNRSQTWVHQRLRLLTYPDDILTAIHTHGLPLTVADLLAQIPHDGYRAYMVDEAVRHGASAATAACWLAHYQTERIRLETNTNTVEEIAATRSEYRIYSPCEYCGDRTELQLTRMWRLCAACSQGLAQAKTGHHQEDAAHVRA